MPTVKIDQWKNNLLHPLDGRCPMTYICADNDNVYAIMQGGDKTSAGMFVLTRKTKATAPKTVTFQIETAGTYLTAEFAYLYNPDDLNYAIAGFLAEHDQKSVLKTKAGYEVLNGHVTGDQLRTHTAVRLKKFSQSPSDTAICALWRAFSYCIKCYTRQLDHDDIDEDMQAVAGMITYRIPRSNIVWEYKEHQVDWTANRDGFMLIDMLRERILKIGKVPEYLIAAFAWCIGLHISCYRSVKDNDIFVDRRVINRSGQMEISCPLIEGDFG